MWVRWLVGIAGGGAVAFIALSVVLHLLLRFRLAPLAGTLEQAQQRGPDPELADRALRLLRRQVILAEWVFLPAACCIGGAIAGAIVPSYGGAVGVLAALPTVVSVGRHARDRAIPALLFALAMANVGGMIGNG